MIKFPFGITVLSRGEPERGKEVKNISICDAKDKLEDTSHHLFSGLAALMSADIARNL